MDLRASTALRLRWLLAAVFLIGVAWSTAHLRQKLRSNHDSGFAPISANKATQDSQNHVRHIVSVAGQFITLDPTGRFLINSTTGKPIFLTGDSAWSLITQLSDSDVETYVSNRAELGFNYVWCGAADNYYQSNAPKDYYGDPPFDGPDFAHENHRYWMHVDHVIERAAVHGITVALDPGFVGLNPSVGYLVSYKNSSDEALTAYGEFLGKRYKDAPNLIWALGGDVDPSTGVLPKLTALARGIHSQDKNHLMVAEGQPQHAAPDTFGQADWMDLNWLYFHTTNIPTGAAVNYARTPHLPPFLGESWYEREHSMTPLQLREQGYWAVLSGAYLGNGGFGNSPMWYFNGGPSAQAGEPDWHTQLRSPGSMGQMYLGKLFRSREHWKLIPDVNHTVMTAGYDSRSFFSSTWESLHALLHREPYRLGSESSVAARTDDGQTIIAYIPNGKAATITIAMSSVTDAQSRARCWWFNPRDGSSWPIGSFATSGMHSFTAPDTEDWVLVIDSQRANLSAPGTNVL